RRGDPLSASANVGVGRTAADLRHRSQRGDSRVARRTLMLLLRGTLTLRRLLGDVERGRRTVLMTDLMTEVVPLLARGADAPNVIGHTLADWVPRRVRHVTRAS